MLISIFKWLILLANLLNFISALPAFDRHTENVTVIIGSSALLPCFINNLGDHKVAWIKVGITEVIAVGDFKIINDERINLPHSYVNDWSIVIDQVNEEDIGEYICQVNTEPQIMKKIFLHVLLPPKIIEEKSTINPNPVTEGESLTLFCHVDGLPEPTVSWYHRKKPSHQNTNELHHGTNELIFYRDKHTAGLTNALPVHEGNTLTIENISRNYSGYFECIANNSVPPAASRKIKVTVEFPPEVNVEANRLERLHGADVRLECKIKANPLINHYWIKDGRVIENSLNFDYASNDRAYAQKHQQLEDKYEININNNNNDFLTVSSLLIRNLSKSDFGHYECFAVNKFQTVKATVDLREIIIHSKKTTKTTTIIQTTRFKNGKQILVDTDSIGNELSSSTVAHKNSRKYHKKMNHTSAAGVERTENDINSELGERSSLYNANSNSNRNNFNLLLLFIFIFIFLV